MAGKDYYKILGVKRGASDKEIKQATVSWHVSIIRMSIRVINQPNPNSKRSTKPTRFSPIRKNAKSMTSLAISGSMPINLPERGDRLGASGRVVPPLNSAILIPVASGTFLVIFSEDLVGVVPEHNLLRKGHWNIQ